MHDCKPTVFRASRQEFTELGRTCRGQRYHDVLAGAIIMHDGKSRWATSLAWSYPAKLPQAYARIASRIAPRSAARRDGNACPVACCALGSCPLRCAIGAQVLGGRHEPVFPCPAREGRRWRETADSWGGRTTWAPPRFPSPDPLWSTARSTWPMAIECHR